MILRFLISVHADAEVDFVGRHVGVHRTFQDVYWVGRATADVFEEDGVTGEIDSSVKAKKCVFRTVFLHHHFGIYCLSITPFVTLSHMELRTISKTLEDGIVAEICCPLKS
jgi:hypothetical protein